jgi:hypothetical protein
MYQDNSDDDMPPLESPSDEEEQENTVNPAEDCSDEEEGRGGGGNERTTAEDEERQPNDYDEYIQDNIDYDRQSVLFPSTFTLPPQLSRASLRQRQEQVLSEILYANLRRMMYSNNNDS